MDPFIESVYDLLIDPQARSRFVTTALARFDAEAIAFFSVGDESSPLVPASFWRRGVEPDSLAQPAPGIGRRHDAYYRTLDPWRASVAAPAPGQWQVVLDASGEAASGVPDAFSEQFLAPEGLRHMAGVVVRPAGAFASSYAMVVYRGPRAEAFDLRTRALLDALGQHLVRAERIAATQLLCRPGDASKGPSILMTRRGELATANEAANELFERGLLVRHQRHFAAQSAEFTNWLVRAQADPRLAGRELLTLAPGHLFLCTIEPVVPAPLPGIGQVAWRLALLPAHEATTAPVKTGADYGWSRSEAEVVDLLSQGMSVAHIARSRACSLETVRSHVKNAKLKAGVRYQSELATLGRHGGTADLRARAH